MSTIKFFKRTALIAALTFTATTAYADIKIGFNSDMSASGAAEQGLSSYYGVQAAIDDINNNGGVLGQKLELIARDDVGQPPKAIQNMNELIDKEKVVAVIGPANSGNALAWLHIPQRKKIPVISAVATSTDITQRYADTDANYIFRVSMVDREQIAMLVAYAVKSSKDKKIGFLVDNTGYGQQGLKDLQSIIDLHGIKPVAVEQFGSKDTDMTSQLSKIKAQGTDTLIVYGLSDANGHVLRSMEKIDYFPTVLGSWTNINTPMYRIAGQPLAGRFLFTASTAEDSNPAAQRLSTELLKKYPNMTAFTTAAHGYDAVLMLAQAITQANSTEGPKIQAALENLGKVDGIVKTYEKPFDKKNHEALSVADFHLARWENDRVVTYEDEFTSALTAQDYKR